MTPALVLGSAHATTLEVVRILGRRGIPQFAVGAGRSFVSRSRWHRPLPGHRQADSGPASLAALLARLPFERMALIPCTDDWVRAAARLEPALAARFSASLPPRESLDVLLDKARLAETARRLRVPHPRTVCLASEDDLAALPDPALRGAFLKPRDTLAFQRRYGVKALAFETRAQAAALVRDAGRAGLQLVLQEYVPGPPDRHYFLDGFVDRAGVVRACIVSRRMRMFPTDFGDGSYGVSVGPDEVGPAMEVLRQLLGALRYRGVFDAEFKYDERDGLFKLLEVNTRPYTYVGFAALCGVDLVHMAYRDALGLAIESVTEYRVGDRFLNPYTDLPGGWRLVRQGRLAPWTWARSWVGAYQPTLAWDDPLPGAAALLEQVWRAPRGVRSRPRAP